ncbi:MAG: amidohydrolase family protein [Planctomycetes bacterium]|nr:amidohydrolase family protein [Planctomycetota bacterium]
MRIHTAWFAAMMAAPLGAQTGTVVLEASRIVVAPRTVVTGDAAKIAMRGGQIVGVGTEISRDALDGAKRIRFDGATIVPGLVVAHDYLDLGSDLGESIDAFTPSLVAADAFDPFDAALRRFADGGVTSVGLAPASENTFGGLGSVVQWHEDGGEVLLDTTYLKVALVQEALDQNRYPTSRMGAADLVRRSFEEASAPLANRDRDQRTLTDALAGSRNVAIHARTEGEIVEAIDLCRELGIRPILLGGQHANEHVDALRDLGASVVLGTLDFGDDLDRLRLPAILERAGVPFSFAGSHPIALRRSAALAVRHGASRDAAMAALTRVPAEQLGLADKIGGLRRGQNADLAVFSGDPIDLTSKRLAVFITGERVALEKE